MPSRPPGKPDPIDVAVGARMKIRRVEQNLSQLELARELGLSFQQIQKYEHGYNRVSASMLVKAARALKCPVSTLLGDEQGDDGDSELLALLATTGAVELLRLFAQIHDNETRQSLLSITRGIAGGSVQRAG